MFLPLRSLHLPHNLGPCLTCVAITLATVLSGSHAQAQGLSKQWRDYFEYRVSAIEQQQQESAQAIEDWGAVETAWRSELFDMLGLNPLPPRGDLKATITGERTSENVIVENLHFQSLPGLYVTGNLYRPAEQSQPAPAVLYLCGHGGVKENGVSYGNKVHYHHHGIWFAEHGYVCLIIDSLQLGEIEAIHHGTYRYDRWWWVNRGYTPAGVEAWNCIRAVDYLQSRQEVDPERLGCTGRSGGGAYSWWVAALDPRIRCAAPVAGITDLRNHIVDDCVAGHCDCMYFVNRYQWDYPRVAQLCAPRALLIANSDQDSIFPLDGVVRTHRATREHYERLKSLSNLGLTITPGPHQDTQPLRMPVFHWFDHFIGDGDRLIDNPATKRFEPSDLQVFTQLPKDEINTRIDESFVPTADRISPPPSLQAWNEQATTLKTRLQDVCFRSWPTAQSAPPKVKLAAKGNIQVGKLASQGPLEVGVWVIGKPLADQPDQVDVVVLDAQLESAWQTWLKTAGSDTSPPCPFTTDNKSAVWQDAWEQAMGGRSTMVVVAPRGLGELQGPEETKDEIQFRRRLYLLGETLESGQIYDVLQTLAWINHETKDAPQNTRLFGSGRGGVVAAYASLWSPDISQVIMQTPPSQHAPTVLLVNIDRVSSLADVLATVASQHELLIENANNELTTQLEPHIAPLAGRLLIK